jgi:O-acetyl-ADP-ribose deacetylase (regulator of RNase III)
MGNIMSVTFIRGDITKLIVDAIVNAANNELRGGGGVDGAIHAAAGAEQLHAFCRTLGGCPTGGAKLSPGFNLPAKFIIHTVGPVWRGGAFHEKTLLISCYLRSLELAQQNNCKTVAFPLISAGAYGYPYEDALQIAYDSCQRFLNETKAEMEIYIVLYQGAGERYARVLNRTASFELPDTDTFQRVANYIREHYHFDTEDAAPKVSAKEDAMECAVSDTKFQAASSADLESKSFFSFKSKTLHMETDYDGSSKPPRKEDFPTEETFTQLLIRFMREKHKEAPEVYNDACLDRKLFSKILSNAHYQPKKYTAVRLALGLKLSPQETDKLLNAAGFALSRSKLTDLVIAYCISHNKRDVWEVNGILEDFGLTTI